MVAPEPPEEVNFKFNDSDFDVISGTMIEIDAVTFRYSLESRVIFKNMDLSCDTNSRIAIVGENGAGKLTRNFFLVFIYIPKSAHVLRKPFFPKKDSRFL